MIRLIKGRAGVTLGIIALAPFSALKAQSQDGNAKSAEDQMVSLLDEREEQFEFDPSKPETDDDEIDTTVQGRRSDAPLGEVGRRLSNDDIAGAVSPYRRIASRLETRIESRLGDRINPNPESIEENQARTRIPRSR